jgi:hypothetical protein
MECVTTVSKLIILSLKQLKTLLMVIDQSIQLDDYDKIKLNIEWQSSVNFSSFTIARYNKHGTNADTRQS